MQHAFYLFALVISLLGLLIIDKGGKIAFWRDWRRSLITLSISLVLFVLLDCIAIAFGIFTHGTGPYSLPFTIVSELPVEEVVFLLLLSYCSLLVYLEAPRWRRTR